MFSHRFAITLAAVDMDKSSNSPKQVREGVPLKLGYPRGYGSDGGQ